MDIVAIALLNRQRFVEPLTMPTRRGAPPSSKMQRFSRSRDAANSCREPRRHRHHEETDWQQPTFSHVVVESIFDGQLEGRSRIASSGGAPPQPSALSRPGPSNITQALAEYLRLSVAALGRPAATRCEHDTT